MSPLAPAALLVAACLCCPGVSRAGDGEAGESRAAGSSEKRTFSLGENWALKLFPFGHIYPIYIADPRRSTFAVQHMEMNTSDILEGGGTRTSLKMGARFGFLRFHPKNAPARKNLRAPRNHPTPAGV